MFAVTVEQENTKERVFGLFHDEASALIAMNMLRTRSDGIQGGKKLPTSLRIIDKDAHVRYKMKFKGSIYAFRFGRQK